MQLGNLLQKYNGIFTKLFFGVFLVSGLFVSYFGYANLTNAFSSTSWPTVDGKVINSEMYTTRGDKEGYTYGAKILYIYTISNKSYFLGR